MNVLSKLDPDTILLAITFFGTVGKWLIAKVRHQETTSLRDALWPIVEGTVYKLADSEFNAHLARVKLEKAARDGMGRIGLKPNRITDAIVAELVERGVTEVRRKVLERKVWSELPARTAALEASAAKVAEAFTPPSNPTVPKLELDVEIVPP